MFSSGVFPSLRPLILPSLVLALSFGCFGSSGPELINVEGKVTSGGAPVAGVSVIFVAQGKTQSSYRGTTDKDGKFILRYLNGKAGLPPGNYTARVEAIQLDIYDVLPEGVEEEDLSGKEKRKLIKEATVEPPDGIKGQEFSFAVDAATESYDIGT